MSTNPKRIPRTQADVDKAFSNGQMWGAEFMLHLVIWILKEKHDAPSEDLHTLADEINNLCDSIGKGYVSYPDIKRTLKSDYNLEVKI